MMRWLTDCPDSTACFLPEGAVWKRLDSNGDDSETAVILSAFNDDKPAWLAESTNEPSRYPHRYIVLIDQASTSQFDQALKALKSHPTLPDGLVCLALTGSGFRGQRERPWHALRGNMHLTAHYELGLPARENQAALTMLPAVASAEAISDVLPVDAKPEIKWVNDVRLGNRKVSGVLTATHVSGTSIDRAVFGIGINAEQVPEIEPTPFVPEAGSLMQVDEGIAGALPNLFSAVVDKLDELVVTIREGRQDDVFQRYVRKACFVGRDVRIWPEGTEDWRHTDPLAQGRITSLNEDLSLNIAGLPEPVCSGRMAFEENC